MKLCVVQARPVTGKIEQNIERHITLINLAIAQGASLITFPELSITGYEPTLAAELATTPDDPRFNIFQQLSNNQQVTIMIGVPIRNEAGVYISLVIFQPDQPVALYSKKHLHADEEPYFSSGPDFTGSFGRAENIALAICYEISVPEHAAKAAAKGASIYMASVAKTVKGVENAGIRLPEIARTHAFTILMANGIGQADGEECGGRSAVWNNKGEIVGQLDDLHEGFLIFDTDTGQIIETVLA